MSKERKKISKGRKIAGYVLLAIVAAGILYCAAVLAYRLATASPAKRMGTLPRFFAEFGILCLMSLPAFDLAFGIFSWGRNKAAGAAGISLRVVSIALCVVFVALGLAVAVTAVLPNNQPVGIVCVLGNAIDGDKMSSDLVSRLDTAIAYHEEHPDVSIIVTGGNTGAVKDDPYYSEAGYMARYLSEHGIDDVVLETNAMTTVENFVYLADMVDKAEPLGVITTNHHLFRATHIAKKQGYTAIVNIPAPSNPLFFVESVVWEATCSFFSILQGNMAL